MGWLLKHPIVLVLFVVIGAACNSPPASNSPPTSPATASPAPVITPSGPAPSVVGTVTAGPVCPVERIPADPACAPRPVAGATIVATDGTGQEMLRTTTGADGTYTMKLDAFGAVTITALPVAGLMDPPDPVTITVSAPGEVIRVDLLFDTGIR